MESFETYRTYLFSVAYRMLGSTMDAEDMVQETYLRFQKSAPDEIVSLKAYLTTIVSRLCMDQLGRAYRTREQYVGPWLPEPVLTGQASESSDFPEAADPEWRIETEESISLAFLILLEELQPFERAVFLLREVFDYQFAEIAAMLQKSETACRRTFSRAKARLIDRKPRFPPSSEAHSHLLTSFLQAVQSGDMAGLTHLLTDEVTLWTDAGGRTRTALLRPIHGRDAVMRACLRTRRLWPDNARFELEEVNGQVAVVGRSHSQTWLVLTVEADANQIQTIRIMLNPDKLSHV